MANPDATPSSRRTARTKGEVKVWLTAAGLTVGLIMISSLLLLIAVNGLRVFWPAEVTEFKIREPDGSVTRVAGTLVKTQLRRTPGGEFVTEHQIFTGNKDAYSLAFRFLQDAAIKERTQPRDLYVAERVEYGDSIFNGMRTLSANIAVELPEAAQGSTHYRTLFLGALVLFGMTFLMNTFAEVLRQKLREKYKIV